MNSKSKAFIFKHLALLLVLCSLVSVAPLFGATAFNMFSGAQTTKGPAWMTVTLQGNAFLASDASAANASGNLETWKFESANLFWTQGGVTTATNVLDGLLLVQTFEIGSSAQAVNFVYNFPEEVLKLDTVDLSLQVKFRTSGNEIIGPVVSNSPSVDLKSLREVNWKSVSGSQDTLVTFSPGSYLTYDFNGAGLYAGLGYALNMGNIQVTIDGGSANIIDLYPSDVPASSNPTTVPETRYVKTRLYNTQEVNGDHQLKITLMEETNPRSQNTGLSLTSFTVETYFNTSKRLNDRDVVVVGNPDVTLYSYPAPFDANVLTAQLGLSSNLLSLATAIDQQLTGSNVFVSDNTTTASNTSANTTANLATNTTAATNATNNTTVTGGVEGATANAKATLAKASQVSRSKSVGVPSGHYLLVEVKDDIQTKSWLYSESTGELLKFSRGDRVHQLKLHVVSPIGMVRSAAPVYHVPLSNPSLWATGQSTFSITVQGSSYELSRTDSSETWEVGLITLQQDGLSLPKGTELLVVQRHGQMGPIDFSISGSNSSYSSLGGQSGTGTSFNLSKANVLAVKPTTPSNAVSSVNSGGGTSLGASEGGGLSAGALSGGGGGGCLLD
jgi:hypothetical protein